MTQATDPRRHTFVLRCWYGTTGVIRARLIDVVTGVSYPVARLSELPPLIESLMDWPHRLSGEVQKK